MESRIHGDMYVRFGGRFLKTYRRKAARRRVPSLLKEIVEICKINKHLTMHTARHTYGTLSLSQGVSLKNVSKMLGHASVKMTERYARVLDSSILRDMNAIRDTLNLGNK